MAVILSGIWVMATGSLELANWGLGAVVGVASIGLGREHPRIFHRFPNIWAGIRLIGTTVWVVVTSSLRVAWLAVKPGSNLKPAIVEVPVDIKGDYPLMLFANLLTLSPGSLAIALDEERGCLYLHSLIVDDEAKKAAVYKSRYESLIIEFFGK